MSTDGLEPPGCPLPGACSCPGGEAELATRLANAIRERDAAIAQLNQAVDLAQRIEWCVDGSDENFYQCPDCYQPSNKGHALDCGLAAILADAPIPDRLAAEREAGQAVVDVWYSPECNVTDIDNAITRLRDALRDAPAEGGER